jgi:hypothetical protein
MSPAQIAAAAIAAGRLAFGAGLIARPDKVASGWLGPDAERPAVAIALRALGARDIALSAGALAALGDEDRLAHWVGAAMACDLADVCATLATPADALPGNARWGTVALGGGTALAGAAVLAVLKK